MSDLNNSDIDNNVEPIAKRPRGRPPKLPKKEKREKLGRPSKIKTVEEINNDIIKNRENAIAYYKNNKKDRFKEEIEEFEILRERIIDLNRDTKCKILFRLMKQAKNECNIKFMEDLQTSYIYCC